MSLILLVLTIIAEVDHATYPSPLFLLDWPEARNIAMAGTGLNDDASLTYANQAALAFLERPAASLSFSCSDVAGQGEYRLAAAALPVRTGLGFGAYVNMLDWGYDPAVGRLCQYAVAIGAGYSISSKAGVGTAAKYIRSHLPYAPPGYIWTIWPPLYDGVGSALGFDFSVALRPTRGVLVGLAMQNVGSKIRYTYGMDYARIHPLPRVVRTMASINLIDREAFKATVTAADLRDASHALYNLGSHMSTGVGLELAFFEHFYSRGGYYYSPDAELTGPTYGFGLKFHGFELNAGTEQEIYRYDTVEWVLSLSYCFR